jgi:hypothetical protein
MQKCSFYLGTDEIENLKVKRSGQFIVIQEILNFPICKLTIEGFMVKASLIKSSQEQSEDKCQIVIYEEEGKSDQFNKLQTLLKNKFTNNVSLKNKYVFCKRYLVFHNNHDKNLQYKYEIFLELYGIQKQLNLKSTLDFKFSSFKINIPGTSKTYMCEVLKPGFFYNFTKHIGKLALIRSKISLGRRLV